ncbi:MAG TPA: shikimate dehydrogenase [Chitinophagaceae bacterium]|nr:shikimate dehydrogenase [Chitinophagaceae bacterium]
MRLYGLIGYPLTHSFSKKYFTEKFEREGLSPAYGYELFPIPDINGLPAVIDSHPELAGLNVTIPYKEQVLAYLGDADTSVKQIGACNCIRIDNGRLKGYNTDVTGFHQTLLQKWQPSHNKALILGTGGAAKAVQWVLAQIGIPYQNVSRKAGAGNLSYSMLTPEDIAAHPLIINTTPLGMYPAADTAPLIPYEGITPGHYLYDLVYNPATTLFLQKGQERGATIQNGAAMLVIQAEESWKIWQA